MVEVATNCVVNSFATIVGDNHSTVGNIVPGRQFEHMVVLKARVRRSISVSYKEGDTHIVAHPDGSIISTGKSVAFARRKSGRLAFETLADVFDAYHDSRVVSSAPTDVTMETFWRHLVLASFELRRFVVVQLDDLGVGIGKGVSQSKVG